MYVLPFNKYFLLATSVTALALLSCGKQNPSYSLIPDRNTFQQNTSKLSNKIDILWVVDNSGSMKPLQTNLVNNFKSFISGFETRNYDFQMAVTTTDAYLASDHFDNEPLAAKFRDGLDTTSHTGEFVMTPLTPNLSNVFVINATQGDNGSGDERAFSSFRESLNSSLNIGFSRPNSFLAVIIVSDEDDFSSDQRPEGSWLQSGGIPDQSYTTPVLDTVDSYVTYLDALTGTSGSTRRYNVSSITVLDDACKQSHVRAAPSTIVGKRYIELSGKTNGVTGSVCDTSFATSLKAIETRISELSTQFVLSRTPVVSSITVLVDGVSISEDSANGWTYDANSNSIIFHGTSIPPQDSVIDVNFDPVTVKE